jgi:hypothetical protein
MPRSRSFISIACIGFAYAAFAQQSPLPGPSSTTEQSVLPAISPEQSKAPSPTPEQMPSPSPTRSVRISFVPPPMEGTISLGIYDQVGKLVRVLHQNAKLNEFTIGTDALVTRWDGRDDAGQDLPDGRYHAHGYLVGTLTVKDQGESSPPTSEPDANTSVKVQLLRNPLRKDKKPFVELGIGFNASGTYLKSKDGLPLFKVSETPGVTRVWIAAKNENAVEVWQDDGAKPHQFMISNVDQMMAFNCGDFQLK